MARLANLSLKASAFALTALTSVMAAGDALSAPAGLLNKSVRFSITIGAQARGSDGSNIVANRTSNNTVYISSQGRLFSRAERQEGRQTGAKLIGPEGATFRIQGKQIVVVFKHTSGASRLIVDFDPDFRTCTLTALTGGESGKPVQSKGINGVMYTAIGKPSYTNPSCSVTEGNAFGG